MTWLGRTWGLVARLPALTSAPAPAPFVAKVTVMGSAGFHVGPATGIKLAQKLPVADFSQRRWGSSSRGYSTAKGDDDAPEVQSHSLQRQLSQDSSAPDTSSEKRSALRQKKKPIPIPIAIAKEKRPFQATYTTKETVPEFSERYGCIAYAAADRFDFKTLREILQRKYVLTWLSKNEDFQVIHTFLQNGGEIFFFNHGSAVSWGASEDEVQACLKEIMAAQVGSYQSLMDKENMEYIVDPDSSQTKMIKETIVIATKNKRSSKILNEKLALSNGIARSAKLGVLERQIERYISKTKHIPGLMQQGKKIPLSRNEVYKNIGELMNFRGYLNLHSELLEAPDFYWSEPELEELFSMISRVLDVNFRVSILNKKLDYVNELVEVLRSTLSEWHGLKLEWAIIVLILIEVIFECLHYADKMGLIDPTTWI